MARVWTRVPRRACTPAAANCRRRPGEPGIVCSSADPSPGSRSQVDFATLFPPVRSSSPWPQPAVERSWLGRSATRSFAKSRRVVRVLPGRFHGLARRGEGRNQRVSRSSRALADDGRRPASKRCPRLHMADRRVDITRRAVCDARRRLRPSPFSSGSFPCRSAGSASARRASSSFWTGRCWRDRCRSVRTPVRRGIRPCELACSLHDLLAWRSTGSAHALVVERSANRRAPGLDRR